MKRLTGTDSLFLSIETPSWHQHIGGLTILEPGDRPVTYEAMLEVISSRLDWAPKFRWKLHTAPMGLDLPGWVDDEDFDIRRHVHRAAVPAPGGFRETAAVASRILSVQLDRRRPLWEIWFLEGLAEGRVALVAKFHHCLADGMASASLATVLLDLAPDATEPMFPAPPEEERLAGPPPSGAEVAARVAGGFAQRPVRVARYAFKGARKLAAGAGFLRNERNRAIMRAPMTPFNAAIGSQRALSFASVSLDDIKRVKSHHGVTVNDVVLALSSTALRRYLLDLGELPDTSLVTGVPVSTRAEGDTTQDNQVSMMFVPLATDVADPIERLRTIHDAVGDAKAMHEAMRAHKLQSLGELASPLALSTAFEAMYRTQLASRMPARINTLVSNVPGPPVQLYALGAKVTGVYPCSVIMETMGLNITVISFLDRLDFGFHVDPDLVPDPWAVAAHVPAALAELLEASGLGAPTPIDDAFGHAPKTQAPKTAKAAGPNGTEAPAKKVPAKKKAAAR